MIVKIPYEDVIAKIVEKSGLSQAEVEGKIKEKLKNLSGLISKEGAAHIVANDLGVSLFEDFNGTVKINKLLPGLRSVETAGRVKQVYEVRSFQTKDGREGKVGNFLLADDSGSIRVVLWNDQTSLMDKLTPGVPMLIRDAYTRDNQGRSELHVNDRAKITLNPPNVNIPEISLEPSGASFSGAVKKIKDLAEGDQNVALLGTVVQAFDIRFFDRKDGGQGYVLNMFLDDGSDNIRAIFFGRQALDLLGISDDEMMRFKTDPEAFEPVKFKLLGQIIKIQGRVSKNEMFNRLEFVANSVDPNPDPEKEIKNLPEATLPPVDELEKDLSKQPTASDLTEAVEPAGMKAPIEKTIERGLGGKPSSDVPKHIDDESVAVVEESVTEEKSVVEEVPEPPKGEDSSVPEPIEEDVKGRPAKPQKKEAPEKKPAEEAISIDDIEEEQLFDDDDVIEPVEDFKGKEKS